MFSRTTSSTLASLIISALVLPLLSYWKDIELVSAYTDSSISEETDNSLIYVFIDADTKEALSQSLEIGNKFYSFLESLQDAGKDTYTGLQGIYNTLDSQIAYGGDLLAHWEVDWIGQVLYQAEVGATDGDSTTDPDEYMASAIADKLSELEDADLDESVSIDNPLDTYLEALRGVYKETDTQVIELDGHTGVGFVTPEQQMTKYIADVLTLGYESKKVIGGLFIGDIPLPLVQRDGGLDRSAFPYSDVANRYYEYEEDLEYWTQDQYQSEKNAEIWSAFMLSDDSTGRELIRYFHRLLYLYAYAPNNGAATQQDSLDMYREKHMVQRNEFLDSISSPLQGDHDQGSFALFDISGMERAVQTDQYGKYQFFIDHQDDVLYDRVNKKMKADITGEDISFVKNTMSMRDRVVNTPLMQFCVDNAYPNCSLSEPAVATYCSENAIADADCDAEPVDPYNFFTDAPEVPAELAEVQKNMGEQLDTMYQYEMDIETLDTQNKFLVRFLQMFGGEFMGDSYEKVEGLGRYERDDIYDPAYLISAVDAMIGRELKEIDGFFENMFDTLFFDDLGRWDQDIPVTTGIDQQIYSGSDIWQEREQYYNSYPLSFIAYTGWAVSCNNLEGVNANMMHSEVLVMNLSADGWEVVDAGPSTAGNYSQSTDSTRLYDIAKPMADMPYQGNCQIVGVMNGMDLSSAGLTKSDGSPVMGFYDLDLTIDQDASTETTVVYSQPDHYAYYTGVVVDKIDFMKIQNETLAEWDYCFVFDSSYQGISTAVGTEVFSGTTLDGWYGVSVLSDAATHDVMSYMSCPVFETGYQELSSGSFVHMMDSRRFHVSPDPDTGLVEYQRSLHKMAQDGASVAVPANIPADDPRGVSFMDGAGQFQFLDYINFFDFLSETVFLNEELADFQRWLDNQTSENLELLIEGVDSFLEDSDDDSQVLMTSLLPGITVSGVTYGVDDYEYRAVVMMALYKSINGRLADVEVQYFGNTFADFSKKSGSEVSDVYRNWVDMPQTFDQFREEKWYTGEAQIGEFEEYIFDRLSQHLDVQLEKMDRSNKEAYLNLLAIYFKREERVGVYMDFLRKMQRGDSDSSTGTIDWIDTENKILNGKQLDSDLLYGKAIELYEDWILDEEEDLQDRKEQMLRYVADRDILKFFELIYELGNEMTSSVSDVSGRNGEVFLHWLLAVQPVEFLRLLAYSQAEEGSSDGISGAWDRADMATVINMYDELHNNGSADWVIDRWVDDSVSGPVFVRDFLNDVMQRQVWRHKDLNSFDEVICDIDVQGDVFFGKYSGESDAWPYYTNEGESDFGDCVVPSKNALVTVPLSMVSAHYTAWKNNFSEKYTAAIGALQAYKDELDGENYNYYSSKANTELQSKFATHFSEEDYSYTYTTCTKSETDSDTTCETDSYSHCGGTQTWATGAVINESVSSTCTVTCDGTSSSQTANWTNYEGLGDTFKSGVAALSSNSDLYGELYALSQTLIHTGSDPVVDAVHTETLSESVSVSDSDGECCSDCGPAECVSCCELIGDQSFQWGSWMSQLVPSVYAGDIDDIFCTPEYETLDSKYTRAKYTTCPAYSAAQTTAASDADTEITRYQDAQKKYEHKVRLQAINQDRTDFLSDIKDTSSSDLVSTPDWNKYSAVHIARVNAINAVGKLKFAAAQASTSALYGAIESAETSIASYLNVSINGDIVDNRIAEVYDWMSNTGAVWDGKTDGNWDFPYWNDNSYRLQRVNNVELQTRYEIDGILTWIFGEQVDPADDFAEEIDDEFSGYYNDVEVEHNAYMAGANHEPVYAEIPYFEIRNMTGSTSIFDKIHSLSYTGAVWMDIALTDTGALADIVEDAVFDHAIALPEDSETFADANFMTSSSYDTLSEVFSGVVYDASSFLSQRTEYIRDAYADLQNYTGFEDGIHDSITEVLWDYLGEEENGIAGYSFEIPETDYDREVHKGRVFQYLFREFIDDDLAEENISQENRESKTWYGSTGSVVSDSIFPGMNMSSYTYRQFEYQGAAEKLPQDITVNETRISEYAEEFSYDYQFAGSGSVSPWTGPGFGKNNIHKTMQILDALRDSPSSNLVLDSYTAVDLTTKSGLGTAFVPGVNPSNTRLMGYTSTGVDGISIADTWIDGFDASTKEWNTLEYLLELKETIPTWIVDTLQGETPSIARSYTEEDDLQESLFAAISDLRTAADMSSRTGSVLTPMLYSLNDTIVDDWVDLTLSASFIDAQVSSPVERSLISSPDAKVDNINTEDIDESIYCDEDELERLGIPETNAIGESSVDNLAACKPNTLFERIALDTIMDMEAHEAVQSTEKVYPSYDSYDTYYPSGIEYLYYTHLESRQRPEASESVYPFVTWNYETPTTRDFAQSYHIDHSLPFITTDFSQKETVAVDTTADIYMQPGQGKTIAYENIKNKKNLSLVEWKVLQPALDYTGEGELLFVSGNDTHSQDIGDVDYHLQDKQHRVLLNNNFDALIDASMGVSIGYRTQVCGNGIVEDGRAFGGIKEKCDDENTNPILTFDPTPDDDTDTWVPDYCSADCLDGTGGQEDIVYWDTQLSQFQLKANADEAVDEVFRGYYTDFAKEYREKLFFFYQWRNMSPPEKVQKIFIYGLTGNLDELFTFDVSQIVNGLLFYFLDTDDNETTPMELVPHAVAQTPYSVFPKVPFYDVAYINVVGGDHMMSIDLPEPTDAGSFSEFDQAAILRNELQAKYEEMRESPCDSEMGDLDTPAICPVPSLPESGVDPADLDYSYEEMLLDVLNGGMVFVDDQEVTGLARENIDTGNLMQQAREVDQQAKKLKDMTKMNDIELPEAEMPKKEALSYLGAGTYYGSGIDIGSFDFGELVDKSELSDVQSFLAILSGGNYGQQHENIEENFSDSILYSADSKALAVVAEINTTSSDTYFPKYFSKDAHAPFLTTFAAGNPLGDTLKHHAMDTLIVYGDPGLRMAHPQVPVRMGWDTVSIFADMKDKGYFSWAFPSMVGLDWNKEWDVQDLIWYAYLEDDAMNGEQNYFENLYFVPSKWYVNSSGDVVYANSRALEAQVALDNESRSDGDKLMRGSPSYKNFEKKYIVFSRSFVDRTLGKEVFRIPVPVEKIYSGFFMSNHHEDLLVYTQNNRFVLYTYQDTGYTLFKELGEAIVLPVGSTFIDLTVGDFAHGDGYDEILLNTDKGLVTFINKGQVGARYFQMAGATVAGGDVSQRFLSIEPIQIQGPDAGDNDAEQIVYTKANGEMGVIFDLDFENTENNNIILRTGDESFDLDMSDTFADVHASGNDDDQSAMEYRKLFTRVPEAYISMVSFPEDMTMLQLPGYDASGSVEMRELAQEERVFVKTYKTSEMMVDGSEVVTTLDQLCPGYYPGVCDQVQYSSPMQCLDARAANPDFNFTQYADACARTVLHDHPELATPLEESDYSFFYKSNATASSEAFLSKYNYLKANADNALPEDENVSEKVSVAISFDYSSTINVGKQYLSSYAQDYVNYTPAEPTAPSHVVESQNDKQDEYWQDWAADIQPWVSLVWQAKQQADTDCQSAIDTYVDEDLCAPIIDEGQDACDNNPDTEAKKSAAENKVEMKQQYCSDPWNDIADFDEITEFFTTPDWADKSVRPEEEGVAHWYGTAAVVAYNALISVQSNTYLDPIWEDDQGQDLQNVWNTDIAPTLTVHEHTLGMLEAMNDGNSEAVSALGGAMRTSFVEFDWDCAADADDSQQQNCTLDVSSGPGMDLIAGQYAPDGSVIDIIIPGDDRMNIESVVASGSNLTMIDTISPVLHPNLVQTGSLLYDGKSHSERFALRILTKKSDLDTGLSIEVTGRLAQLPSPRLRVFDVDKTYASGSPADISGARENADYYPDIYIGEGETQHYFINQQDETFLYRIKDDAGFADSWEIISSPSVASLLPNSLNIFQKIWNAVVPFASASGGDAQKEKVNPPVSDRYKQANNKVIANMAADATDSVGSSKQMEWGSDVTDSFENLDEEAGSFEEEMDRWNEDLQEFKSYFKCSGGCVALPVNIAISMGVGSKNSYFAPTTPAWPPYLDTNPVTGAIDYGIGIALTWGMCGGMMTTWGKFLQWLGVNVVGAVFGWSPIPSSVCNSINDDIGDFMQGIADWFNDSVDGVNSKQDTITIVGGADAAGVIAGETISGGVTPTYKMTSYTGKRMNQMFDSWDLLGEFVISGFPSAITKWVDRQIARFKKSLMPPAIKLRYPVWQQGNALAAVIEDTSTDWADVLNYIANLPVVNIKTERIQVDLPAVSSQDLALMKKNMIDWINDIGSQMESKWCMNIPKHASGTDEYRQGYRYDFMAYGSDVETVTNEEGEEVFDAASLATLFVDEGCTLVDNSKFKTSLVVDASELGSSVKRNLEIIDVYLALPQTIYQYKYALEIYAKQIMDQIRQLVQITGGWFVMNMKVIQQWFTFIKMIQTIIQGWEALISIINGIVQSCSTCKSYRLDLTTWIMELIGGMIPTPPDINFPRWPDVVVDVSGVTLEMDIRWPSLDIRPVPFDFPVLPRLNLPEIPPFKIDYNYQLALPSVPILPPPPDLPPLPSLQVLPDWELPYLDAPPKLPAAPGSIKSFLSVVETVMNIACFIYTNNIVFPATTTGKGTQDVPIWMTAIKPNFAAGIAASFVPVPFPVFDMWIAQCEVLTERPMSPVLPIDFSFNWNIGDIDLTIVDEIVAYATVDAVIDLDPTYTFYESADRVNEMTKNFNEDLQGTLDAIQEDLDEEAGKMNERFAAEQDRWEESKDNFEEYMAHNVGLRHFQEKINAQQEKFDEIDANSKALTAEMLEDMEALSDQMEECMKSYENDANGDPVGDSAACKSGYGEDDEDEETAMFLYPQLQCSPTSLYAGHVKQAAAKQRYLAQLVAPHTEESQKYYASLETGLHSIQQKQEARDNNFEDTIRQYFSVLAGRDISFGELRNTFEWFQPRFEEDDDYGQMLVDQQQQLRQIAQSYKNIHQESQKEVLDIINAPTVYTEFLAQADVFLEDYRKKNIAFKQALDSGQEFYMLASAPSFEEKETLWDIWNTAVEQYLPEFVQQSARIYNDAQADGWGSVGSMEGNVTPAGGWDNLRGFYKQVQSGSGGVFLEPLTKFVDYPKGSYIANYDVDSDGNAIETRDYDDIITYRDRVYLKSSAESEIRAQSGKPNTDANASIELTGEDFFDLPDRDYGQEDYDGHYSDTGIAKTEKTLSELLADFSYTPQETLFASVKPTANSIIIWQTPVYSYTGRTVNYWDITGYNDLGMTDVVYQQLYLQKPGFVPHEDGQVGLFDISDIDIQVSLVSPLSSVTTWTPSYFLSTDGLEYRYMESGDMVFNPTNSDIDIEIYRYSLEDDPEEITISAGQKYIFVQPANKLVLEDNDWRMMRKVDYAVRDINKDKQPDTTLLHGNDDSDGDGLPDTYEDTYSFLSNTQPLDVMLDPDSDGLNMKEEYLAGASPVLADSDGDGVSDRIEIESGTDPIVSNLQSLVAGDIILPGYQTTISSGATLSFDYGSDFSYTTPVSDENITFVIDFHKEDTSVTFRPIYAQDMAYYRIGSQYKASPLYRIDPTWWSTAPDVHAPQARISLADTSVSGVGDGAFALLAGIQSTDNRGIVSYEWKISTASGSVRISDDNIVEMGEFSRDIVYPASIDAGDKDDPFVSFPFDINNNYRVELTVTDAAGNSDTTHRDIYAYQHLPEFSIGRQWVHDFRIEGPKNYEFSLYEWKREGSVLEANYQTNDQWFVHISMASTGLERGDFMVIRALSDGKEFFLSNRVKY